MAPGKAMEHALCEYMKLDRAARERGFKSRRSYTSTPTSTYTSTCTYIAPADTHHDSWKRGAVRSVGRWRREGRCW